MVEGKSRLIVQTWDHSGEMPSWFPFTEPWFAGPAEYTLFKTSLQVDHIIHSPAVPKTSEKVTHYRTCPVRKPSFEG